jgi:carbon-monoxide dehydrogenase iron sulfur subunit
MMRPVLVFDRDRCLACRSCELACSVEHSASAELESAIAEEFPPTRRVALAAGADGLEALRCEQCLEPLCAFACKSGALRRDPATGRVMLDDARCVGCYMCLMVCPFGIRPDPARDRVVRCDVCEGRATPACVEACPTGALRAHTPPDERVRSGFEGHVLVVGSSAAGIAACEAAREHAPACSITLVTADSSPYSRPLLSYALAGRLTPQQTDWRSGNYLEHELGVHVLGGRKAVRLDPDVGALTLDNSDELGFERLILATGARAAGLSIPGANLAGVFALRDAEDLEAISNWCRESSATPHAVVLGGGNVGLQACEAFLQRGLRVTVVVASPHLLSQMPKPAGVWRTCSARTARISAPAATRWKWWAPNAWKRCVSITANCYRRIWCWWPRASCPTWNGCAERAYGSAVGSRWISAGARACREFSPPGIARRRRIR